MKVLVIGGAGFIGSHLVDRLLAAGHAVDVLDDLSQGSLANLADARAVGGELKIHHLDGTGADAASLVGMRRPDVIYQLALFDRHDRSALRQGAGFAAALTTVEAARQFSVGRVVVALPSTALYGQPAVSALPVKESDVAPRGVRGIAARAVVDLLTHARERDMVEFSALALGSVYGPRQRPSGGVVAAFLAARSQGEPPVFHGDGRQTRDFVFVDDAVDALVRAGERSSGLLINVGTGEQTSIRDLWSMVAGASAGEPRLAPPRPDEVGRFAVSPVRARIHLGWAPWTDLATGLARCR